MNIGHCEHTTPHHSTAHSAAHRNVTSAFNSSVSAQAFRHSGLLTRISVAALTEIFQSLGECYNHYANDCHYYMVMFKKQYNLLETKRTIYSQLQSVIHSCFLLHCSNTVTNTPLDDIYSTEVILHTAIALAFIWSC